MTRYTKNSLKADLADLNEKLASKGIDIYFRYEGRNNYHAVDVHNSKGCLRCLDSCEPPARLYHKAFEEYVYLIESN